MSELNIPATWAESTLGEISNYVNGRNFKTSEWSPVSKGLPIIRIQNLNKNNRDYRTFNFYDGEFDDKIYVNNGDLLFCWSGAIGTSFGARIYDGQNGLLNQHIFKVILPEQINKTFYFYQLIALLPQIEQKIHGGVGLVHITKEKLISIPFSLPPAEEQNRIVHKIETYFNQLNETYSNLEKSKKLLVNLKNSFHRSLVNNLDIVPLEELITSTPKNGFSPQPSTTPTKIKSLKLSATTGGIFNPVHFKYISEIIPENSTYWLNDGDILIQRANSLNFIGSTAIYRGRPKEFIYPDLMMKVNANDRILPEYLTFCLQLPETQKYFQMNASGAASNMPKINQTTVLNTPIPIGSIQFQKDTLLKLEIFKESYNDLELSIKRLLDLTNELKKSILNKAFTGQLAEQVETEGNGYQLLEKILSLKKSECVDNKKPKKVSNTKTLISKK